MNVRLARLALLSLLATLVVPLLGGANASAAPADGTLRGRYVLRFTEDFARDRARTRPMIELADGTLVRLDLGPAARANVQPGSWIAVQGDRHGNRVTVDRVRTVSGPESASAVTGTKRIAVVLVNFSDNPSQPYTPAHAQSVAFTNANSVAAYYAETSWGQLSLTGDVFGWYTIPDTGTTCAPDPWVTSANTAATAAGVNLSTYDHVVYAFPSVSACGWAGLGVLPGRTSWLNGPGAMSLRVMSHELGHNFGTHHASTLSCTVSGTRVALSASSSNCATSEYGDPFTVMGGSTRYHHTSFSRANFGWMGAGTTATITGAGDYPLAPIEVPSSGTPQMLLIPRTASTYLSLEYRQPYGSQFETFASTDPVANGVSVRVTPSLASRSQSQLVDATPSTTSFTDAALLAGQTLVDPLTGISITVVSVTPSGATVRVVFAADTSAPSAPASLSASALDTSRVSLSWPASTDDVAVTGYRVYRNGSPVATLGTTTYTDAGLASGATYAYQVVAFDAAGNVSAPASASATTLTGDTQAPTAPTDLRATTSRPRKVRLTWTASSDNVAVTGYRIYRNGVLIKTTTTTSFSESLSSRTRSATYYVVAFDAAGNVSGRSSSVSVAF